MERTHVELPARFFPGGRIRIWSQPVRSTILLECLDKNRRFNRDVRNELQQRWNREVLEQLTRGYKCQSSGNTMYLDIPTKDLPLWLCLMEEICQRSEPPLLRLKRGSQNG